MIGTFLTLHMWLGTNGTELALTCPLNAGKLLKPGFIELGTKDSDI